MMPRSFLHQATRRTTRLRTSCRHISSSFWGFANDDEAVSSSVTDSTVAKPHHPYQSAFDESPNWRDWFHPAEYENPWDKKSTRFQFPLDHGPADATTRHLIQLLQKYHAFAHTTTEHCNAVLEDLHQLSIGQPSIAERAYAILENMEYLEETHRTLPRIGELLARPLPKPNRTTYNTVLKLFAKTVTSRETGPELAKRIVSRMQERYEEYQELELRPNPFHWNCVILAYMECDDPDRAIFALKLMLDETVQLDASSYIHFLRMCGKTEIGANVAVRMWQETLEKRNDIPELPSVFYSHFLQAIRSLPDGRLRSLYYDECFGRAKAYGKVNRYILKEFFLHNRSDELFKKHFGSYQRQIYGMQAEDAMRRLLSLMPLEWSRHAD